MKKYLLCLLLAPVVCFGQNVAQDKPVVQDKPLKMEAGLSTGLAFSSNMQPLDELYIGGRTALSFYYNFERSQVGGFIEAGFDPLSEGHNLTVAGVVNKTIKFRRSYVYGGGMLGYRTIRGDFGPASNYSGYIVGLQGGMVYHLGKHFGLNAEIGARSEQLWSTAEYVFENPDFRYTRKVTDFNLYFPVNIGVRYRF